MSLNLRPNCAALAKEPLCCQNWSALTDEAARWLSCSRYLLAGSTRDQGLTHRELLDWGFFQDGSTIYQILFILVKFVRSYKTVVLQKCTIAPAMKTFCVRGFDRRFCCVSQLAIIPFIWQLWTRHQRQISYSAFWAKTEGHNRRRR